MTVDDALYNAEIFREAKGRSNSGATAVVLADEVLRLRTELARTETELDELHRAHELNSHE